jgi:hypothetical protein
MLESNKFLVTDPQEFDLAFHREISCCGLDLKAEEDGFHFTIDDLLSPTTIADLCQFLQRYLKDDTQVIQIHGDSHVLITSVAFLEFTSEDIFRVMLTEIYPRKLRCITSCHNRETGMWIEANDLYIAVESFKSRGRSYYTIRMPDGHEVAWGKEYFDAVI